MKMHILYGGALRMKASTYYPDMDRDATIDIPCSCYLLRHPQGNVLFDTGCHPAVAADPASRWGSLAKFMPPIHAPGQGLLAELGKLGLKPDDIDVVVNSHLHTDHCGCNEFFKKANVVVHVRELETARNAESEGKGYFRADWDHPNPIEAIEGQRDLFGDGRIVLVPVPGHSPGTIGALVSLDRSGSFFLASDAVSVKASLDRNYAPRNTWDKELLLKSLAEIRRIEAAGSTVLCGHDPKQWETLRKGSEAYD